MKRPSVLEHYTQTQGQYFKQTHHIPNIISYYIKSESREEEEKPKIIGHFNFKIINAFKYKIRSKIHNTNVCLVKPMGGFSSSGKYTISMPKRHVVFVKNVPMQNQLGERDSLGYTSCPEKKKER